MCNTLILAALVLAGVPVENPGHAAGRRLTLKQCPVSLIHEAEVPAMVPGVLVSLAARQGMEVQRGMLLAQIDDSDAQLQKQIAQYEYEAASEQAKNDIDIRYARAATLVAEAEHVGALAAQPDLRTIGDSHRDQAIEA